MKISEKSLRSYQPEVDNYKQMKEIMDRNWKKLMEEKNRVKGEDKSR